MSQNAVSVKDYKDAKFIGFRKCVIDSELCVGENVGGMEITEGMVDLMYVGLFRELRVGKLF